MLFNSFKFLAFFPIVVVIYYLLPHKFRWFWLLLTSCIFYMAFVPVYILILFGTIVVDYFAGILIERGNNSRKKTFLIVSLVANIGILCVFKYYNFFIENVESLLSALHISMNLPLLSILLPIGLSFHTFQAMSYTIEVYYGNQKAERNFGIYALYVMFFPQLVAGPIERPQNMLHQFREKHFFDYDRITSGLRLMAWGLFKKVVVADRLSAVVDNVYKSPASFNSLSLIIAVIFYAIQIFCDFSGYSDIALGSARVLGFNLMLNFNNPFVSKSVTEFWRRWHISLSTWIRDYLFTPLVVSTRKWGKSGVIFSMMFTFTIIGLWHGAGWTFVIFGALQGIALSYEVLTTKLRRRISKQIPGYIYNTISIALTFSFACFSWIFFRARNIETALFIIKHIFTGIPDLILKLLNHSPVLEYFRIFKSDLILSFLLVAFIMFIGMLQNRIDIGTYFKMRPLYIRWFVYFALVFSIVVFGSFGHQQFIYFQF
jgi:alginate O-acetyltransferase complex protein AlgI